MRLFKWGKSKKEEKVQETKVSNTERIAKENGIKRHKQLIDNLEDEYQRLFNELKLIETDSLEITKVEREKVSDKIIKRLSIIEYEVNIRRDCIKWLS